MKLSYKLFFIFLLPVLLIVVISNIATNFLDEATELQKILEEEFVPVVMNLNDITHSFHGMYMETLDYLLHDHIEHKQAFEKYKQDVVDYLNKHEELEKEKSQELVILREQGIIFRDLAQSLIDYNDQDMTAAFPLEKMHELEGIAMYLTSIVDEEFQRDKENLELGYSQITDSLNKSTNFIFIFGAIAIFLSLGLGLFIVKDILDAIKELQICVSEVGKQNFNRKAKVKTGDEIEELAKGFNKMANQLKTAHHQLEKKVIDKTTELKETKGQLKTNIEKAEKFHSLVESKEEKILDLIKKLEKVENK